ncbi:uncharacterized protein K460DRAFT_421702 [Cucurbitaria berberidis CBS 394.84]|uniref:Uncharacterized protein n=1 Tax=Cucurbitaria berberidis CBS 394.84 TaxID=1168544 RepID=A0A9P4G6R4_9PLEO|nr:uncharacterized protein K460DRAFT_421702 [Cucurbitaria berberidis CBS 394.84]KAF1840046.1 hypothetical protein K460DRAFT_421702 [Cucurbitaria berberidis CBS 394.84]
MFHHHEPNDPTNQPRPQAVSPDRPPQWKRMNCGYRCGWGCEEPGEDESDGGGSDDETVSTLVDTDDEESPMIELPNEEVENHEAYQQAGLLLHESLDDGDTGVVVLVSGSPSECEDCSIHSHSPQDYDGRSESLEVEPCATGDHSTVASSGGSAGNRSPVPGFDYIMMGIPMTRFPPAYYFLETPLRLSPQDEHCRGHTFSPMVLQDEILYLDVMGEMRRSQIPRDRMAF